VNFLNDLPLATLISIAGIGLAIVGYLSHDLTIFEAMAAAGITSGGAGAIGHARNGAGRGLRK
jgi:hypothetical protein